MSLFHTATRFDFYGTESARVMITPVNNRRYSIMIIEEPGTGYVNLEMDEPLARALRKQLDAHFDYMDSPA